MGVGVEAPGRDHHSMTSPNNPGHSMTNGFNSDNHSRSNGGKQCLVPYQLNKLMCCKMKLIIREFYSKIEHDIL